MFPENLDERISQVKQLCLRTLPVKLAPRSAAEFAFTGFPGDHGNPLVAQVSLHEHDAGRAIHREDPSLVTNRTDPMRNSHRKSQEGADCSPTQLAKTQARGPKTLKGSSK